MIHGSKTRRTHRGFTLIELMLAMTFVAILLLAIAMTIIRVGAIYSKGMALKDINQSARLIADDIKRTAAAAGGVTLDANGYVTVTAGSGPNAVVVGGRLCLGTYSYVWNTVDAPGNAGAVAASPAAGAPLITLVKVPDTGRQYCARNASGALLVAGAIRAEDTAKTTSLLVQGDHSLSVTSMQVTAPDAAYDPGTAQRLILVDYSIGTGAPTAMTPERTSCSIPGTPGADEIYCNVQQFNLVVRSGSGGV